MGKAVGRTSSIVLAVFISFMWVLIIPRGTYADQGYPDSTSSGLSTYTGSAKDTSLSISFTLVNTTTTDINYITFSATPDWNITSCGSQGHLSISTYVCQWGGYQQPTVLHPGDTLPQTITVDLTGAQTSPYNIGFYDSNTNVGWPTLEQQDFNFDVTDLPIYSTAGWGFCVYATTTPGTGVQQYHWKTNAVYNGAPFEFIASSSTTFDGWLNGGDLPDIQSIDSDSSGTAYLTNGLTGQTNVAPADSIETAPLAIGLYTGSFTMSNPNSGPTNFLWTDGRVGWFLAAPTVGTDCGTGVTDTTAPALDSLTWSSNPVLQGQNTTLSVNASDSDSGISGVDYTINSGVDQPMPYNPATGNYQASFGSGLSSGTYTVVVKAIDNAGNISTATDVLAVYNPANGYVNGHAKIQPTESDVLPIAQDSSRNPSNLVLGFTNVTSPASGSFAIDYSVKNNYNEFTLTSTALNWIVVPDSSHASILGQATLTTYVNGVKTVTPNVTVRYDISIGTPSTVSVKIFAPGVNPNMGSPEFNINDSVISSGSNLMLHP